MSATITAPVTDPTAGLELISGDVEDLRATRHLFLAANLLDPGRQRDINLPDGGEELANVCLRRTTGKLPKCEITPLEFWVEWMPKELFPEGLEHLALSLKDNNGEALKETNRIFKPLLGYPYYPAHTVIDALGIANGEHRGIVEIQVLKGVEYGRYDRELQELFFGREYIKPVELRLVEEHILQVADSVADPDAKSAAEDMIVSVTQSRDYMLNAVSVAQTQLAERVSHKFVHRLTPKIRSFMAQLEMKVPAVSQMQDVVDRALTANLSPEVVEQLNANNAALIAALGPAIGEAIGKAVREAMAGATVTAPAKAPAKKPE